MAKRVKVSKRQQRKEISGFHQEVQEAFKARVATPFGSKPDRWTVGGTVALEVDDLTPEQYLQRLART